MNDPNTLKLERGGGGCVYLFGVPFLFAGIGSAVGLISWAFDLGLHEESSTNTTGNLMGVVFGLVGVGLVFGRTGITIDRRHGTLTKWSGLLGIHRSEVEPLQEYSRVVVGKEQTLDSEGKDVSYPITLEGPGGRTEIGSPQRYRVARDWAGQLVAFLDLKLVNNSKLIPDGLREPLKNVNLEVALPGILEGIGLDTDAPMGEGFEVKKEGDNVVIDLPAKGWGTAQSIALGAVLVTLCVIYFSTSLSGREALYLFSIPLASILLPCAYTSTRRDRILLSPTTLEARRLSCVGEWSRKMKRSDVEEFEIGDTTRVGIPFYFSSSPPLCLIVYGKGRVLSFGLNRPYRELRVVEAVLKKALEEEDTSRA